MKYIISRTSSYDKKPCKEAFKYPHEIWHTRTCTEVEFNEKFADREGLWRSKGKNHKVTKEGYITRQEKDKEMWTIEINSLEELHNLSEKYGLLTYNSPSSAIEIYDDYRE